MGYSTLDIYFMTIVPLKAQYLYWLVRIIFYIKFTGKKEEVWVIDDLIIDGHFLNNFPILSESFEGGPQESNWLFYPGGNIDRYCLYQKTRMWVSQEIVPSFYNFGKVSDMYLKYICF